MIAVGSEEGGGKVEDVTLLDHQRAAQGSTYRGLGMAGEVLPGAVEEGSAQLTVGRGPIHRTHLMRLFIEDVIVVSRYLGLSHQCLVRAEIARRGRSRSRITHR